MSEFGTNQHQGDAVQSLAESLPPFFTAGTRPVAERWYALRTRARHEKHLSRQLEYHDIQHFLPLWNTMRKWRNGVLASVDLPLFPTYVFVKMEATSRFVVEALSGAVGFVGSAKELWPMSDGEVDALREGLHLHRCEPYSEIAVGERVRVRSGAFANLSGTMVRSTGNCRVVLSIDVIKQGVSIEIDSRDLEILSA